MFKSNHNSKSGFSLVELLVVIAIVAVLSVVAYVGIQGSQLKTMNEKVTADLLAIQSALDRFKEDNGHYPNFEDLSLGADKNVLCFGDDMAYMHLCEEAAFLQTQIDNSLLTKRYLQEVPTDPRTGSRYSYGVTQDGKFYQVAGIEQRPEDDAWMAQVVGNLEEGSRFPGLIRAFDAPNFVVDEGEFLPYSPTPMTISARLNGLEGTVMVNNEIGLEGQLMQAGDKVKTGTGSTVVLYLSDGSITYLDENTELQLLPSAEVGENDKDSIITKIRLKLFQGSTWNKVVHLADESEFNIETTSAIAGVRGTEFGIDAGANELVILSGTVATRMKTGEEEATTNGEGQFLTFNVDEAFTDNQNAEGTGEVFRLYKIPAANQPVAQPKVLTQQQANDYRLKYYQNQPGLSASHVPYLIKAQSHPNGSYTIYVTFNGLTQESDNIKLDGFELFGSSQASDIRILQEDAKPLLTVKEVSYDAEKKAYQFELPSYSKNPNDPFYNEAADFDMESILLRAFQDVNETLTYSQLSWPAIGLLPDKKEETLLTFDNANVYQEFEGTQGQEGGVKTPIEIIEPDTTTLALNEGPFALEANVGCDWAITEGEGIFTESKGVKETFYNPINSKLPNKDESVAERFNGKSEEKVIITCTDPEDGDNKDTLELTVSYAPRTMSGDSGYWYSYASKSNTSWTDADMACNQLEEGGFKDWKLPSMSIYKSLDITKEKMNLCQYEGGSCKGGGLESAKYFLLSEDDGKDKGYMYVLSSEDFITTVKNSSNIRSYRCVRNN